MRSSIAIELPQGVYQATLYFLETDAGEHARSRRFDVLGNGRPWLKDFNILEDVGEPWAASIKRFRDVGPDSSGVLRLAFRPSTGEALLNAIEIEPAEPGRQNAIRLLAARESHHYDDQRRLWLADRFVKGGTVVRRSRLVKAENPNLYGGERYGDFRYLLPAAPGRYRLTLHMAELWFGTAPAGPRSGRRLFSIYSDGAPLIEEFELMPAAGGAARGYELTFEDLRPDKRGYVELEFRSLENFAMINALELEPMDGGGPRQLSALSRGR